MTPVRLLMLSFASLTSPRADRGYISLQPFLLSRVRLGRQLDQSMEGYFHPRTLLLRDVHEVCVDTSQDGLMGDDQDVLAAFQLHYNRFESNDHVAIRLSPKVAVVVLVFVALCEVLGVLLLDLGVS